jgi:deoxyribonuclease V
MFILNQMELFLSKFNKKQAEAIQAYIASNVIREKDFRGIATVTGADVAYSEEIACAAFVTLRFPDLAVIEEAFVIADAVVPYRSGFLAFREGPSLVEAYARLKQKPELLVFDGHGIAHPRRAGLASHLGLLFDTPSIGCAKENLCGTFQAPAALRGSFSKIIDREECIGAAVRTQEKTDFVFVSIGHRIDLSSAIEYVLYLSKFRIPEPIRLAHILATEELERYLKG